ncbi:MAG: cytochrome P460 family protein [Phycisphaerales bacterium]
MPTPQRLALASTACLIAAGVLSCATTPRPAHPNTTAETPAPQALAPTPPPTPPPSQPPRPPARTAHAFEPELLAAARDYRSWPRVTHAPGWKPELCSAQAMPVVLDTFFSYSDDADTHGGELYHLYPSSFDEYMTVSRVAEDQATPRYPLLEPHSVTEQAATHRLPAGFAIVKETWSSVHADPEFLADPHSWINKTLAVDERDGQYYVTDQREELFIMLKTDPATPDTDQGWVYAVVSADAQTVLASGLIDSCIGCHRKAPIDRLFGLPGGLMSTARDGGPLIPFR